MADLKELIKPPFANYDIVVYFGGGLFSLPFAYRYLFAPLQANPPSFLVLKSDKFVVELISSLSALVCVYVIGHLIAYLSSQFVEKAMDRLLGKVSTAILVSVNSSHSQRNSKIRSSIKSRIRKVNEDKSWFSSIIRAGFHLPNILHYFVMYKVGVFGYFDSRLPPSVLRRVGDIYKTDIIPGENISTDVRWFKALEYFAINRYPDAVARMYNYLVIAGLFRSLAFVFLASSWAIIAHWAYYMATGVWGLNANNVFRVGHWALLEWFIITTASVFCVVAYIKFQRRYAEEAIFSVVFAKP